MVLVNLPTRGFQNGHPKRSSSSHSRRAGHRGSKASIRTRDGRSEGRNLPQAQPERPDGSCPAPQQWPTADGAGLERVREEAIQRRQVVAVSSHRVERNALEREISHSIEKDIGRVASHGGLFVLLRISASGLDTKSNAAGGFLTAPRVGDILDALINQSRVLSLGAKFISGVRWAMQFLVEISVHQASWVSENPGSEVSESDPSFGMRTVSPHSLQSCTSISRQLPQQANPSLEGWLRSRIARAHALCIDAAAIFGSGVENQSLGLLKTAEIGDVALGANGLAPTTQSILDLESAIGAANADSANCAFLTTRIGAMSTRFRPV